MKTFTDNIVATTNLFILMCSIPILLCSCSITNTNAESTAKTESNVIQNQKKVIIQMKPTPDYRQLIQISDFNGVSLTSFIDSVSKIHPEVEPALILESEDNKPDSVRPRFISLSFHGDYAKQRKSWFFSPKIRIYPIEDFRHALSKSSSYVQLFDKKLISLNHIISTKQSKIKKEMPFIPFIDGSSSFVSHLKHISFKSGNGIMYLTQFDIEPSIVNNDGLTYIFQGLTSDGKHYVLATFPIKLESFPNNYDANSFGSYKLPNNYNNPKESDLNAEKHRDYILEVEKLLSATSADEFEPNLNKIEQTITSLEVK